MIYNGDSLRKYFMNIYHLFRINLKKENTMLSIFIHKLKDDNANWEKSIKWEILYSNNQNKLSKVCTLCNLERLEVAFADSKNL